MDSAVTLRVGKHKKTTKVVKNSDSPFFNEYFVFEFSTSLQKLYDKIICFTVFQPKQCSTSRKILGFVNLDVGTVWAQPYHQVFHKWAIIVPPGEAMGAMGYIKVDIHVLTKGQIPYIPTISNAEDKDEIEGNLLLHKTFSGDRQKASFVFKIYKADISPVKKGDQYMPNSFIRISFAGLEAKTSIKKHTLNPVWNEKLVLNSLFPPLCQRIKIDLKFSEAIQTTTHAQRFIYINRISNDGEKGFLPTFGPTFLYLYNKSATGTFYVGRLLIEISTEVQELTIVDQKVFAKEEIPLSTESLAEEGVVLFCSILNSNLIDKQFNNLRFEIHCGPKDGDKTSTNKTDLIQPKTGKSYNSVDFLSQKPCLCVKAFYPDLRKRLFNSNKIEGIAQKLKTDLENIQSRHFIDGKVVNEENLDKVLPEILTTLENSCRNYTKIVKKWIHNYGNDLDYGRLKHCLDEIEYIASKTKDIFHPKHRKKAFRKLVHILEELNQLIEDPQECWPNVFLWMTSSTRNVAVYKIKPRLIVYSSQPQECGKHCAKLQDIFLKPPGLKYKRLFGSRLPVSCRLHVFLWMGLEREFSECLKSLPPGLKPSSLDEIPKFLISDADLTFQCRAHIYSGRLTPGADYTGLCDPFVKVILENQERQTETQFGTLSPVWDQMLAFQEIVLYGNRAFYKKHPPLAIVEVFDKDKCYKLELLGRCLIYPSLKLHYEPYSPPSFPPKLKWYKLDNGEECVGEILVAIELLELTGSGNNEGFTESKTLVNIPEDIKPVLVPYKFEVVFWGVRNLKKIRFFEIAKPRITVECGGSKINSTTISNSKKSLNFTEPLKLAEIYLPLQEEHTPPLSIKIYDNRCFGRYVYGGTHLSMVESFLYHPLSVTERNEKFKKISSTSPEFKKDTQQSIKIVLSDASIQTEDSSTSNIFLIKKTPNIPPIEEEPNEKFSIINMVKKFSSLNKKNLDVYSVDDFAEDIPEEIDINEIDWWSKYYASGRNVKKDPKSKIPRLKIYTGELESQPEFNAFQDTLKTFEMHYGKRTGDETVDEENITALFKGAVRIYRPPQSEGTFVTESGMDVARGVFQDFPGNEPQRFIIRVYVVKGMSLRPKDLSGKSDPYLGIVMGEHKILDKENYIAKQLNPVFGRCFEMEGVFSRHHSITISVWDWDLSTADDLIGETTIDIENRFYSKHRARCGIPRDYIESGACRWRDQQKPSQIIQRLCRKYNIEGPTYHSNFVEVGPSSFKARDIDLNTQNEANNIEVLSLTALRRWSEVPLVGFPLVPEHVETRSLYRSDKPGIEQGKLQLWVDIYPFTDFRPPVPVDISPRKPVPYELRVIIWNTEDVSLQEDSFFIGEKMSDIYVKGYLHDTKLYQNTDVHYRSLTGEGNFNWRFIFPFLYLAVENKMVIYKKDSVFSRDQTEYKLPCKLTLQVWDNDTFSSDDFLGTLSLDLSRLPRGARSPDKCTLDIIRPSAPFVNLFKTGRTKGWWPMRNTDPNDKTKYVLTGKLEAELHLLPGEESLKNPAGPGRDEPQALPFPQRPESSFSWISSPFRGVKYLICKKYKWKILRCLMVIMLTAMIVVAAFSLFSGSLKKIFRIK